MHTPSQALSKLYPVPAPSAAEWTPVPFVLKPSMSDSQQNSNQTLLDAEDKKKGQREHQEEINYLL
jgi:hypothetical protein